MVRRLRWVLVGMALLGLACGWPQEEPLDPPDGQHKWAVVNAMIMSDWGASTVIAKQLLDYGGASATASGSFFLAECGEGRAEVTDRGIECDAMFGIVTIDYDLDDGWLDVDVTFDRWLDMDRSCFSCDWSNWDGAVNMRGQITEDDRGDFTLVFTTDVDLVHVFPTGAWSRYTPGGLAEPYEASRRARRSSQAPPAEDHPDAYRSCRIRVEGVSATYRLDWDDFIGVVTGSPTASCEDIKEEREFEVLCDWYNVDILDADAMVDGCRYLGVDQ